MLESWFPQAASSFAADVDRVFRLILYIVGAWFVVVEGLLILFVLRFRRKRSQRAAYVTGETGRQLAWVLIPGLLVLLFDLGIDAAGARVWDKIKETEPPTQFKVRVTAERFAWLFTHPGPDGRFDTPDDLWEVGTLHVPVGRVIELELSSMDVIHSFAVPSFRLRQDVLPGRTIKAWFKATRPGTYEIECTELCGADHYKMQGKLVVLSDSDYEHWKQAHWPTQAHTQSSTGPTTDSSRG